ncbi:shTK domain protein [Ancylostoma caninum]|uniref:ShTK domain protein n=1 Tax=Ancylostoma caninum TaxID=29170 RepID=A0A368GK33_ANCCA|nr:shTK domain protein [Ancylostoma caninum]
MNLSNLSIHCVDLINPWTGVSDCPRYVCQCNNPRYFSWMTERCPKTCNRCNETRVAPPPPPPPPPVVTRSPYASSMFKFLFTTQSAANSVTS